LSLIFFFKSIKRKTTYQMLYWCQIVILLSSYMSVLNEILVNQIYNGLYIKCYIDVKLLSCCLHTCLYQNKSRWIRPTMDYISNVILMSNCYHVVCIWCHYKNKSWWIRSTTWTTYQMLYWCQIVIILSLYMSVSKELTCHHRIQIEWTSLSKMMQGLAWKLFLYCVNWIKQNLDRSNLDKAVS